MKRNAFGQLGPATAPTYHRPFLRYFAPGAGEGTGGNGDEFKAPESQEDLDKLINGATAKVHKRYEGHDDFKAKAEKWDAHEAAEAEKNKAKPKPEAKTDDTPAGVSEEDVDKRITDALAAERLELALERVNDQLDKALEGRTFSASTLFNLDRKQFVKDGKAADADAIKEWVEKNSNEVEQTDTKRRRIPGQGERDANATGGSVQAGRDLYDQQHKKKSGKD